MGPGSFVIGSGLRSVEVFGILRGLAGGSALSASE
jgi:hypothetical protein